MNIKSVKIGDLIQSDYNPRQLTKKQHKDLTNSLKKFGMVEPILANSNQERNNIIIGGHQRFLIWKELGNKEIPVYYINLNQEKEKELNIRLNKNVGEWDFDMLANEFDTEDLKEFGFEDFELGLESCDDNEDDEKSFPKEKQLKTISCPDCGHKFTV